MIRISYGEHSSHTVIYLVFKQRFSSLFKSTKCSRCLKTTKMANSYHVENKIHTCKMLLLFCLSKCQLWLCDKELQFISNLQWLSCSSSHLSAKLLSFSDTLPLLMHEEPGWPNSLQLPHLAVPAGTSRWPGHTSHQWQWCAAAKITIWTLLHWLPRPRSKGSGESNTDSLSFWLLHHLSVALQKNCSAYAR